MQKEPTPPPPKPKPKPKPVKKPDPPKPKAAYKPAVLLSGVEKSSDIASPLMRFSIPLSIPNLFGSTAEASKKGSTGLEGPSVRKKTSLVPSEAVEAVLVDSMTIAAAVVVPNEPSISQISSKNGSQNEKLSKVPETSSSRKGSRASLLPQTESMEKSSLPINTSQRNKLIRQEEIDLDSSSTSSPCFLKSILKKGGSSPRSSSQNSLYSLAKSSTPETPDTSDSKIASKSSMSLSITTPEASNGVTSTTIKVQSSEINLQEPEKPVVSFSKYKISEEVQTQSEVILKAKVPTILPKEPTTPPKIPTLPQKKATPPPKIATPPPAKLATLPAKLATKLVTPLPKIVAKPPSLQAKDTIATPKKPTPQFHKPKEPTRPLKEPTPPPKEPTPPPMEAAHPPKEPTPPPKEPTPPHKEPTPPPKKPYQPPKEPTPTPPMELTPPPEEPTTPPRESTPPQQQDPQKVKSKLSVLLQESDDVKPVKPVKKQVTLQLPEDSGPATSTQQSPGPGQRRVKPVVKPQPPMSYNVPDGAKVPKVGGQRSKKPTLASQWRIKKEKQKMEEQGLLDRIETFTNDDSWPYPDADKSVPNIVTLAEAGFFYLGLNDCVQCSYCEVVLSGWNVMQPNNDPWNQHVINGPTCTFLEKAKGSAWIEETLLKNQE